MGWPKGVSGNPAGRQPNGRTWADVLREIGEQPHPPTGLAKKRAVAMKVYELALQGEQWAVNFIADRTEGKALSIVEMSVQTPGNDLIFYSDGELMQMVAKAQQRDAEIEALAHPGNETKN